MADRDGTARIGRQKATLIDARIRTMHILVAENQAGQMIGYLRLAIFAVAADRFFAPGPVAFR